VVWVGAAVAATRGLRLLTVTRWRAVLIAYVAILPCAPKRSLLPVQGLSRGRESMKV
jgi:hypothetical protein